MFVVELSVIVVGFSVTLGVIGVMPCGDSVITTAFSSACSYSVSLFSSLLLIGMLCSELSVSLSLSSSLLTFWLLFGVSLLSLVKGSNDIV